jgi:predicted lysophospholipase L1 biosynthesis ABC-type transport system permease subunit
LGDAAGTLANRRRLADKRIVVPYLIVVAAGLALGLVVGRWWTLFAAVGVGAWVALSTGVDEVPPWFLGTAYAGLAAFAIAVGVSVHQLRRHRRAP